ncbi:hypothetical protein [Tenacibaculum agarivorans]|uniref:hypothetical protein n=1 Tax=Tenacibaculum agarivorans TaxID=1908389 RepID=UPI00094B7CFC|nr:hypothetical protein [Tenacibaculum agarivorans]
MRSLTSDVIIEILRRKLYHDFTDVVRNFPKKMKKEENMNIIVKIDESKKSFPKLKFLERVVENGEVIDKNVTKQMEKILIEKGMMREPTLIEKLESELDESKEKRISESLPTI